MTKTESAEADFIEVVGDMGHVEVRFTRIIMEGDEEISRTNSRKLLAPAQKVDGEWQKTDVASEPANVQAICAETWTQAVVDDYIEYMTAQEPPALPRRVGTPREFLHLFTDQEKAMFFAATRQNVEMEIWWAEASTGNFSLDHPSVGVGLGALVNSGILSENRMVEILATDFDAT